MKVLTLEQKWIELNKMPKRWGHERDAIIVEFEKYADLILQSFKPEMITKLFEGWKTEKNYLKGYYSKEYTIYFTLLEINIRIARKGIEVKYYCPETLNDFIRDCQRAGIELQWKEQGK